MPPKNRKGKKNQAQEETTPKHETQEETHEEQVSETTAATHEEEKQPEPETTTTETTQAEQFEHVEQPSNVESTIANKSEDEPKLEVSQNTEVLASSIQSNWDEMQNTQKTDDHNKTLQDSVVEPKENLAESTYIPAAEVEQAVKKAEETVHIQPVVEPVPQADAYNPFLTRSAQEVTEAFARAEEHKKVEEVKPEVVETHAPVVEQKSQAETQQALAKEEPVKETTVHVEPTIEQIQKEEAHQNVFNALQTSPEKNAPVVNTEPLNPNTVILTRSAEEVQQAIARAEPEAAENKEAAGESWIVVTDKHHPEKTAEVEEVKPVVAAEQAAPAAKTETKEEKVDVVEENYVVLVHDKVTSVRDVDQKTPKQAEKNTSGSAAEYFLGSLVSTSAISFVVGKYLLKYPTNKGLITSLVAGVVVGGVSLVIQKNLKNKDATQAKKKN